MKQTHKLPQIWRIWLSFSSSNKQQANYGNNLLRLHEIHTWADFAYIWTQSQLKDPLNYFTEPSTGEFTKIQIRGEMRKIQSIDFFKNEIEPTWQYGDNSKGGYFNFSLPKEAPSQRVQKIYELLVFMALGEKLSICEHIRGVRVVDTMIKKKFRVKFQIWVDYQDFDCNLGMIKKHAEQIKNLLKDNDILLPEVRFFNIGAKIEQVQKSISLDTDKK